MDFAPFASAALSSGLKRKKASHMQRRCLRINIAKVGLQYFAKPLFCALLPFVEGAANDGFSPVGIQMVGRRLGHSQLQTTMRYAHLADEPVLEAAQQNADQLSGLISATQATTGPLLRLVR